VTKYFICYPKQLSEI